MSFRFAISKAVPFLPDIGVEYILMRALDRQEDHRACDAIENNDDE